MRRWAVRGPLIVPEKYDGLNSITQLATTATHQSPNGHSVLVQLIQTSTANESPTTGGYIYSTLDASSLNGWIFRQRGDNLRFSTLAPSSGTALGPAKVGTYAPNIGDFLTMAVTWDGGVATAGQNIYYSANGTRLALDTPSTVVEGSGNCNYTIPTPTALGNNLALTRTYGSAMCRLIHWGGVRTLDELEAVRNGVPPWVFGPVLLDYYNGEDHGPFRIGVVTRSLITPYGSSPFAQPRIITRGRRSRAAADQQSIYPIADIATGGWTPSA